MLAQLLIQFQKPIIVENALQNVTNQLPNDTMTEIATNLTNQRAIRSVWIDDDENAINNDAEHLVMKERFIRPVYASNGEGNLIQCN